MATSKERIWYRDPRGLFVPTQADPDRMLRIIPLPGSPLAEQLNAIVRFAVYYGVVLLVLRRSLVGVYAPLLAAGVTYVVYAAEERGDARLEEKMDSLSVEVDPVSNDLRVSPTSQNPFMNVLVSDYDRFPCRPGAADIQDPVVSGRVEASFGRNVYHDQADIFNRNTNSRQFYTTPITTIPNDQGDYADWLYKTGPTCKEGAGESCNARAFRAYPST
jgi:hypothetical protein